MQIDMLFVIEITLHAVDIVATDFLIVETLGSKSYV
jgi:hypothetical protein